MDDKSGWALLSPEGTVVARATVAHVIRAVYTLTLAREEKPAVIRSKDFDGAK